MIKSAVLLCLLAMLASAFSQCVQDYECGNLPYSVCNGGVNECSTTLPGLAIDAGSGDIYFAQFCRTLEKINNITIKKVTARGGVASVIQTRRVSSGPANPTTILAKVNDYLYMPIESRSPGDPLVTLKLSTLQTSTVDTDSYFESRIDFDEANRKTVVCNYIPRSNSYTIDSYNGILGQDVTTRTTLYTLPDLCTGVKISGSDVYFSVSAYNGTDYIAKVYKGNMASVNSSSTSAQLLFSLPTPIIDFDVSAVRIFYATEIGVYSSDFTGKNVTHISWASGASGVTVANNKLFWNSRVAIISANLDGTGVTQLNQFAGSCGCRSGFSGSTCSTCNGQVQWYEGTPTCVQLGADGNPVTCYYDYECKDSPYSACYSTCQCRYGFVGTHCNQCANSTKSIVWTNGNPSCQ